jgi:hypothetical protein
LPVSCKTAESFNVYFAGVATEVDYSTEAVRLALQKAEERLGEFNFTPLTAFNFDNLSEVKSTLPSPGCIPHWFLWTCASHLSPVLNKQLITLYVALAFLLQAVVTSVLKN